MRSAMLRALALACCVAIALGAALPAKKKTAWKHTGKRAILNDERFGNVLRPRFFLRDGLTQFNHGSFGTVPREVLAVMTQYQQQCEAFPDDWIQTERGYRPLLEAARAEMAAYVNSDDDDLVFVENASDGCNSFLRSLRLQPGDKVLYLSSAYGMVKQILYLLEDVYKVELVEADVSPSQFASPAAVLSEVQNVIDAHGGASEFALALICHIASVPGVILPIHGFVDMLPGVPVFIDGAHAPGVIDLDMNGLRARHMNATLRVPKRPRAVGGAVGYVGNMHKWLFTPKGTAFMWVAPELQALMVPSTLSGCLGNFICQYEYTGTRDYAAFTSVPAGLAFRRSITGSDADFMSYGHELALWAGEHLSRTWGTSVMESPDMTGWMTNVRWPTDDTSLAGAVSTRLQNEYDIKLNILTVAGMPGIYSRISLTVYLEEADVERIGELVPALLGEEKQKLALGLNQSTAPFSLQGNKMVHPATRRPRHTEQPRK